MDDEEFSLNQFDEHSDGHFGETALPKPNADWQVEFGKSTTGRKKVDPDKIPGNSAEEPSLIRRGSGSWQPYDYGHEVRPYPGKPCPISEHAKANPVRSNLRVRSPRLRNLDREEEARLVLAAQGGDRHAARKLGDHFHGWIRHAAWKPWLRLQKRNFKADVISFPLKERAETIDDYIGAGILAFWEAVCGWQSGNKQLCTYAWKRVHGAISDTVWARKAAGFKDETNLARFIRSHPYSPLAAFKGFFGKYTPLQVVQEIARQGLLCEERDEYSEGSARDQGSDGDGSPIEKGGIAVSTNGEAHRNNGVWKGQDCSSSLKDYGCFKQKLPPIHKLASRVIDNAADDSDLRALRHLREVGRRAYAQELVNKKPYPARDLYPEGVAKYPPERIRVTKRVDATNALRKLEDQRSRSNWLLPERKHGPYHDARRTVRRPHVGDGPRRRRAGG
jgi:hypothetical protein